MILRNKICLFALITSLLGFLLIFRHLSLVKLAPIIRLDKGIHPPPLQAPEHNTSIPAGHTHHDNHNEQKIWTLEEWMVESSRAREAQERKWDAKPLKEVCERTVWRDDVIFECLPDPDPANARQTLLTCLLYALDAGATISLPPLSPHLSSHLHTLTTHCPHLQILAPASPYTIPYTTPPSLDPSVSSLPLHPSDLPHWSLLSTLPVTSVKNYVHSLAAKNKGIRTRIPFGPVAKYYPVCRDGVDFVDAFGALLQPGTEELGGLAERVLFSLNANFSVPIHPGVQSPAKAEKGEGFVGVRFETPVNSIRTLSGELAAPAHIPSYERQVVYFLKRMRSRKRGGMGAKVVFVSAEESIFRKFEKDVVGLGYTVLRAEVLLAGSGEEGRLKGLDTEARGTLDYLVMLRAQYFLGIAESEISWAVAKKRRVRSKGGSCGWRKPWTATVWGSAMVDEYSDLMGQRRYEEEAKTWP